MYFSCRRPGCGNFVSRQPRAGSFHSFEHARQSNIYGARVVFHYGVRAQVRTHAHPHTWAHTHTPRVLCATRFSRRFFERQRDGVLKIDLVSEAESVFLACAPRSRPPEFQNRLRKKKKRTSQPHGFRYTASDLHPAEHK